jgi:uncharacterized protein YjiS (DUF1127 family)
MILLLRNHFILESSHAMNTQVIHIQRHNIAPIERETGRLSDALRRGIRRSWQQLTSLVDLLMQWQQRTNDRALLRGLSEYELRDLGLTRSDVLVEADKPFWRA